MAKIEVNDRILAALGRRAREKNFDSVEDYVGFVLEQIVRRMHEKDEAGSISEDDEDAIKEKLRSLGYLE